jgi:hypothetical protein
VESRRPLLGTINEDIRTVLLVRQNECYANSTLLQAYMYLAEWQMYRYAILLLLPTLARTCTHHVAVLLVVLASFYCTTDTDRTCITCQTVPLLHVNRCYLWLPAAVHSASLCAWLTGLCAL